MTPSPHTARPGAFFKQAITMLTVSWLCCQSMAQVTEQILKAFPSESGDHPFCIIQGKDGALYGTLHNGGVTNGGAVFRINTDGSDYRLLHTFGRFAGDGQIPTAGLAQGLDGALYGTTSGG